MRARALFVVTLAMLVPAGAAGQTEPIELSHLYGPEALRFSPELPNVRWMPGGTHYLTGSGEGSERSWALVEAATGASQPLYDPAATGRCAGGNAVVAGRRGDGGGASGRPHDVRGR